MIREAELFVLAEQVLVEVLGRIRREHWHLVLPPLSERPGADRPLTLRQVVERHARDDARVPDLLAGRAVDPAAPGGDHRPGGHGDGSLLGTDPQGTLARLADAACAAARGVTDGDAVVHGDLGTAPVRHHLWQLDITRCLLAHEVAMHLGSRACPLTEELARGVWEGTAPDAERWRSAGVFREPLPMPPDVSWRDRFLLAAGRDPHPLH